MCVMGLHHWSSIEYDFSAERCGSLRAEVYSDAEISVSTAYSHAGH